MQTITLDFETFYDSKGKYSLRSMDTIAYVMDSRFRVWGASVKVDSDSPVWMDHGALTRFLGTLDPASVTLVGHNLLFDAFVLAYRYNFRAALWVDTMAMARYVLGVSVFSHSLAEVHKHLTGRPAKQQSAALVALDGVTDPTPDQLAALGAYAHDDAEETYRIFALMYPHFPQVEYTRMSWCIDMWTQPQLILDPDVLRQVQAHEAHEKGLALAKVGATATQIRSNKQFKDLLIAAGLPSPPVKISPATGEWTEAFSKSDKEFVDLLGHESATVRELVATRLRVKTSLEETRAATLLKVHDAMDGWLPVGLHYCGATVSGRLSGAFANLQNLGRSSKMRDAIIAPTGRVVVAGDLSQIELRIAMAVAGEAGELDAIKRGEDVYCNTASVLYGRPITKADKAERMVGKVQMLSLNYNSGWETFRQMLFVMADGMWVTEDFARNAVATYRAAHPHLAETWANLTGYLHNAANGLATYNFTQAPIALETDGVLLPSGFKVKYTNLRGEIGPNKWGGTSTQYTYTRKGKGRFSGRDGIYGGKVLENICQALAREVLSDIQDRITARLGIAPALQVHDELVYAAHADQARTVADTMLEEMRRPLTWWPALPLDGEVGIGATYASAK